MGKSEDWGLIRERVRQRDKYTCQRCGAKGSEHNLQVHHIIPRAEGGSDELDNLVTLCEVCHDEIHTETTDGKIAKYTGDEFREWIDDYSGEKKSPWDSEFICVRCGHEWSGKPYSERDGGTIRCPSTNCEGTGEVCVEVGELFIPINTIRLINKKNDELDYTGIEFKTPVEEFAPDSLFHYEHVYSNQPGSYIVHTETQAKCERCGAEGAREYSFIFGGEIINNPQEQSVLLCRDCKNKLQQNVSFQFV